MASNTANSVETISDGESSGDDRMAAIRGCHPAFPDDFFSKLENLVKTHTGNSADIIETPDGRSLADWAITPSATSLDDSEVDAYETFEMFIEYMLLSVEEAEEWDERHPCYCDGQFIAEVVRRTVDNDQILRFMTIIWEELTVALATDLSDREGMAKDLLWDLEDLVDNLQAHYEAESRGIV